MAMNQATVAGTVTVAVGGIAATLTAADAAEWMALVKDYLPTILCGWLLYCLYRLEKQHRKCNADLLQVHVELSDLRAKVAALEVRDAP